ncbi:competence/damage-inducible protein A [Natronoflexus pectinivorans]|uniref:CinA-like protein n=1 Tax=Natronoflexus pectinivorans TaxID=682526 RepID=A0A4R2GK67_9BACT|nr:competence/damage-inducible protein A [Natronoflexus pectinivorans]TCO09223.1 nicotinamide-nucleotide amidase [Natronoflexus pectinivorans]
MQVEIITIGDELLIGQVVDTNSAWMAGELNKSGMFINRITSVSDREEEILSAIKEAASRSAIVLLTGGLGPTRDDITKAALCKFFNTQLVFNQQVMDDVERFLKNRVGRINQLNRDQALVPKKCDVIRNPVGTAPIMWFEENGVIVVSMPGVPTEMKHAMENEVLPRLKAKFTNGIVRHRTVHIFNIPEAVLAEMLSDWEDQIPDFLKVAYLPSPGKLRLRISGKGKNAQQIESAIENAIEALYPLVEENIFGFDDEKPESLLLNLLLSKHKTISCAESCSGGLMSHYITSVAGASNAFMGGVVAYSNNLKSNLLGVDSSSIEKHGAVSREVVEQMAIGACKRLGSDYAIASSGIAGPSGGTDEKPVGTVWLAWSDGTKVISRTFNFGNNRERNILRTAEAGIIIMKQLLERGEL